MTKEVYCDILENIMLPYAEDNMPVRWHFQHDNDPKHSSKLVKSWLSHQQVSVLQWPSQSPDLNPIENLWGELKRSLAKETFQNKHQLWSAIERAWNAIPVETCRKLIDSMPRRIHAVIKNKGGHSGY